MYRKNKLPNLLKISFLLTLGIGLSGTIGCMPRVSATVGSVPYPVMLNSRVSSVKPETSFKSKIENSEYLREGANKLSMAALKAAQGIRNPCVRVQTLTIGTRSVSFIIATSATEHYVILEADVASCGEIKEGRTDD